MSKKDQYQFAALYMRLSRDDEQEGESNSIANQRKLLKKMAAEYGYSHTREFIDDGISGTTFNRPGFLKMEQSIENGMVCAVFVKDMSRLGRDYLKVGYYTESFFPDHNVRFVAVNDSVDSADGENEFVPFRNIMNEWYAKDASRKVRMAHKIRGMSGEPLGHPPFGYIREADNKKRWQIDPEAASVVRRIFAAAMDGIAFDAIAAQLTREKVLKPTAYWASIGIGRAHRATYDDPYLWPRSTILKILSTQEYCGDVINFKTHTKSYKNKKRYDNPPEEWVVFEGVHEPIVDRTLFRAIQEKKGNTRTRRQVSGDRDNMFTGYLKCANCGQNLNFHFNQKNPDIKYFNCRANNLNRNLCTATHYIRADFLEQIVLADIRRITKYVKLYEEEFAALLMESAAADADALLRAMKNQIRTLMARDKELDGLFEKIYEDNLNGKLSDERFGKLSQKYEQEQKELVEQIARLDAKIRTSETHQEDIEDFIRVVRKHANIRKLTPDILKLFIDHIVVHHAERIEGKRIQQIEIHYNCVGKLDFHELDCIPFPDISMKTRKGVVTTYSNSQELSASI